MVLALVLRLILAFSYPGFLSDLYLYKSWASEGAKDLWNIYKLKVPPDYPPLYLYILAVVGKAMEQLIPPSQVQLQYVLIKLPAILFDLLLPLVILSLERSGRQSQEAVIIASLLLFNPVLLVNSSLWGQTDALYGFLVLLFCLGMIQEKYTLMMVSFGLLVLLKPTGLFLFPMVILELLHLLCKKRWETLLGSILKGILPCGLLVLPFLITMGSSWFINLYVGGAKKYGYASQRATNLMVLLGGDLVPDSTPVIGGLSYFNLSFILLATFGICFAWLYFRHPHSFAKPALLLLWFSGLYMLSVRMHERYNYVQVLLLALCMVVYKDRRFMGLYSFLSVIESVNHFSVLYFSNHQETRALWLPFLEGLTVLLAFLNLLVFIATVLLILQQLKLFPGDAPDRSARQSTKAH